jgi:hypothetical protein
MKPKRWFLCLFVLPICLSHRSYAQQWSGIIDSSRAINWTNAGIPGGIPNRAAQCGATIAAYGSATAPASAATINSAISACSSGEFVSLGAGTFYLNSSINWWASSLVNGVTLRGQGANSTFLVFYGASGCALNSDLCMDGGNTSASGPTNVCNWTSGYSPGTTTVTLANCGMTPPGVGSLSNLKVGSILILDQLDETNDTGNIWNCSTNNVCANSGQGGFARSDGTCNGTTCNRSQEQAVTVTAINGSQVSISPGLYMPNWRSSQLPQAWYANTIVNQDGVENLSIDGSNAQGAHTIELFNCYQCWVKSVRALYASRSQVILQDDFGAVVRDSYFYQSQSHSAVSYGVEVDDTSNSLVENNICQQVTDSCPNTDGGSTGNVFDYNFAIDSVYTSPGWFQASFYDHAAGNPLNLWEGDMGTGVTADDIHGTHTFLTYFRDYLPGQQAGGCDGSPCNMQTIPFDLYAGARYFNLIGNVLGQPGYHTAYQCIANSTAPCLPNGSTTIFVLGYSGNGGEVSTGYSYCTSPSCTSTSYYDPQVGSYLFRWGNWDVVTNAVRWCGNSSDPGWTTICGSKSEVPTGLAQYANAVPGSTTLPASFYYSSKPPWWTSAPWPLIGPDVSGGNVGICSGGTYAGSAATSSSQCTGGTLGAAFNGEVNANPAMTCFLNVMGGPPDGSGGVLSFDASTCYPSVAAPGPATNLTAIAH